MHEVSVSYFKNNEWQSGKHEKYDEAKGNEIYQRTVNKYSSSDDQVLIRLGEYKDGNWQVLKSESFNFKFENVKKKKKK